MKNIRLKAPEINAGSMADIAFLLLVFFLVTTTVAQDKGIAAKLPPKGDSVTTQTNKKILNIYLNEENQLLVDDMQMSAQELRIHTAEFISNKEEKADWPCTPRMAILSLTTDRQAEYQMYLEVYNALQGAYNDLWREAALNAHGKPYEDLTKDLKKGIRKSIPFTISEAEPEGIFNK